ncbi:MAG: radical SAM protein [Sulfolobales archaeon]
MNFRRLKYVFGPVRSRRLGISLGVNNVPYKTCSYSCIYCQLGRTTDLTIERRPFFEVRHVVNEVRTFIDRFTNEVDYVTFVPDGEPLLDMRIGEIIGGIKEVTSKPVAVITNSSLLHLEEARVDIAYADLVSIKIDSVLCRTWRVVNRPHPNLKLENVLAGIEEFAKSFKGRLVTETMLIEGFNTNAEELEQVSSYIKKINPVKAYIAVPVRPPAEDYARPPQLNKIVEAYEIFTKTLGEDRVELLNLPEPSGYRVYGDPEMWLLNLVSVHPLRLSYAVKALERTVENPLALIEKLRKEGEIRIVTYGNEDFIIRDFHN